MSECPPPEDRAERLARELRDTEFLLKKRKVQSETLYEAGLSLGSSLQVEEILGESLERAVAMVDARAGFLYLQHERTGRYALERPTNLSQTQLEHLKTPSMRARLQRAIRSNTPRYLGPGDLPRAFDGQYMLVVAMGSLGAIGVVDKETRHGVEAFNEDDGHLLELMARQAGTALANARLYRTMMNERNLTQSIVRSIADGLISTDLQGMMVGVNPKVEKIFQEEEVFVGRSCARLFERNGCRRIAAAVRDSLRDGRERQVGGEKTRRGDVILNASITALRDEPNQVRGVVVALEDLTEQTRVSTMLRQYASDQVVDHLLATDLEPALGGVEGDATMLFVDVVGSTELLGQIGAQEMVRELNDCFTRLVEIIFQYNGTLDKYTGDGFLAVFGAPVPFPDDSERAVRSALAISEEMKRFNRGKSHSLELRMGISRGPVLSGNIGSPRRMEYTVIGESVNVGSRLCDEARAGQILVCCKVWEDLQDQFEFEAAEPMHFKGIRRPVELYRLVGPQGSRSRPEPSPARESAVALNIPMVPDMELVAAQAAAVLGGFAGLGADKIQEAKVALIEACINAFEHSQSKDGRLRIDLDVDAGALVIAISDRGHGFDVGAARKRRGEPREPRGGRGWGLELIEEMVDQVCIESDQNGTIITMIKQA